MTRSLHLRPVLALFLGLSMKYFAFYDDNNVVLEVLPVPDSASEAEFSARLGMTCKETFRDGSARGNYAGVGFIYVQEHDIFVKAKPYEGWVIDVSTAKWTAPVAMPTDGQPYVWDEENTQWQVFGLEQGPAPGNLSDADMEVLRNISPSDDDADVLARLSAEGRAWAEGIS
mgnify:FL=1